MSQRPAPPAISLPLILGLIGYGLLAMTICIPSMQEWGAIFGVSQADVQLSFSGYVFFFGLAQLLYGPLSDRHGRRVVALAGTGLAVLAALVAALAPGMGVLVLARMAQGAGVAAGMVVGRALVQDHYTGAARTRAMAHVGMALGLCPPLATILGGQVHVRLGWAANFGLVAVLGLVLMVMLWRAVPPPPPLTAAPPASVAPAAAAPSAPSPSMRQAYAELARTPRFAAMVLLIGATTATFYAFLAGAPVVLKAYGIGPDHIGFVVMCVPFSYIAGNFATSRLAHRLGEQRLLMIGQVLALGGLVVMVALAVAGWRSVAALVLPLLLLGLGHGFLAPTALALTVGLAPRLAGAAAGVAGLTQQWVGALGAYAVGLLHHDGALQMSLLMLACTVCGAAAQAWAGTGPSRRAVQA